MRGRRFALPKDLSKIATVWWLRRLPDLEGVASDFKDILGELIAVCTSTLAPWGVTFFGAPLLGKFWKVIVGMQVCR